MPDQEFSTEDIQERVPNVERFDQDGNVIIVTEDQSSVSKRRFLVSSKILSLASPVFAKLFGPNFSEGAKVASSSCSELILHDDDPVAMSILLSILHYHEPPEMAHMNSKSLAILAIHCDKYDCTKALRPWISTWFRDVQSRITVQDYGHLLLAAHFFRSSVHFSEISLKAQQHLSPDFTVEWKGSDILDLLPDYVKWDLSSGIERLLQNMQHDLQVIEGSLRNYLKGYAIQGLVCMCCGRTHPLLAKKCHPCHNNELFPKHCTTDHRVAEYFVALRQADLWPSAKPFQTFAASDVAFRIACAKKDLRHNCAAGYSCPLELELEALARKTHTKLNKVTGLDLYHLHQNSNLKQE